MNRLRYIRERQEREMLIMRRMLDIALLVAMLAAFAGLWAATYPLRSGEPCKDAGAIRFLVCPTEAAR